MMISIIASGCFLLVAIVFFNIYFWTDLKRDYLEDFDEYNCSKFFLYKSGELGHYMDNKNQAILFSIDLSFFFFWPIMYFLLVLIF